MFSVGDKVAYGGTGVCVVEEILKSKSAATGEERLFYVLRPLYQSGIIRTPVDNEKIPLRPVLSREEAEKLVDSAYTLESEMCLEKNLNVLRNHYQECLSSFRCEDLLALAKSIYAKKKYVESLRKKIGVTDEKYLRRAEELLFGELAESLDRSKDEVAELFRERICIQTTE